MLTFGYFNHNAIDVSCALTMNTHTGFSGDMQTTECARTVALMCMCKEINNTLKKESPREGLGLRYNSISRTINTDAGAIYLENVLNYVRNTCREPIYKVEESQPYNRILVQHIILRNIGVDSRTALLQQVNGLRISNGYTLVEHKDLRGIITLNPNHDAHIYTVPGTSCVYIISNMLSNTSSERYILGAAEALGYEVDENTANIILKSNEDECFKYFEEHCVDLQTMLNVRRITANIPHLNTFLTCCSSKAEIERRISNLQTEFNNYMMTLTRIAADITKEKRSLLISDKTEMPTELIEHITTHELNNIFELEPLNNNTLIRMGIKQPLLYWFEEDFDILFENYTQNEMGILSEKELLFLKDILKNRTVTLVLNTWIRLNNSNSIVNFECRKDDVAFSTMCNPHLYHFNCWGDNAPLLIQATKNRDYLTFWFTLKTTLASINLADGPVFRKFINDFQRAIRQQWRVNVIDKEGKQYTLCKYFNEHYNLPVSSPKKEAPNSVPTQPEIEPVDATVLDVEDTIGGLF